VVLANVIESVTVNRKKWSKILSWHCCFGFAGARCESVFACPVSAQCGLMTNKSALAGF
jgi:hypothetical protein